MNIYSKDIFVSFTILLTILLLLPACGPPIPASSDNQSISLPSAGYPDKGNPKLDSALNQLIEAEKRGEAESFARQGNIELVDGKIRVEIEYVAGQVDPAILAVSTVATVEIVAREMHLIQAVVPIISLEALANEKSIRFIRLPDRGQKEAVSEGAELINADDNLQ